MNRPSSGSRDPDRCLPGALLDARAWPQDVGEVQLVETHISWVFLAGEFAYKVKKPVKLDFLDFSTPALRRHFCEEELRLNRRFAPQLYLGLSQIVATPQGLAVDRPGEVVEYAVRMRRFDRSEELDALLARDAVGVDLLADFGARLAHQQAASPIAGREQPWVGPGRILTACRENFAELRRAADHGLSERVAGLERWTEMRYRELEPRLLARQRSGRFRECHGDLHCANVVRHADELWAFDALEFDPGLHWIDVASDLAFLYMDLRARQHDELASALLDGWLATGGDFDALGCLRFYETYRALVRAKVAVIRQRQQPGTDGTAEAELARYLAAAARATATPQPLLVAMAGVSGSGKSWLASRLLAPLDAVRLRSDVERKRLAGLAPDADSAGAIYDAEMTRRCYARLAELAAAALADGFSVVIDAANLRAEQRRGFAEVARRAGVPYRLLWVSARPATLQARVLERGRKGEDPSEADAAVLAAQLASAEPPEHAELAHATCIDSDAQVDPGAVATQLAAARPTAAATPRADSRDAAARAS